MHCFTSIYLFIVSPAWRQLKAIYQLDMANKGAENVERGAKEALSCGGSEFMPGQVEVAAIHSPTD